MLSVLDLFRIGIGPSSSHTVGPIRIANRFVASLSEAGVLGQVARIEVELQGSLALTGVGHATPKAVVLGLLGLEPETLDPNTADAQVADVYTGKRLPLVGGRPIDFDPEADIVFAYHVLPKLHPNGMRLRAFSASGDVLQDETFYSTGGGFIATAKQLKAPPADDIVKTGNEVPHPFASAADLLSICA
ncbi:serine dehydratase beta chain, partial [Hyphomonas sp.]